MGKPQIISRYSDGYPEVASVGQGSEHLLLLYSWEGGQPLKPAELETVKQKLGLFDFLTPNECRALIESVEQLQEELREIIDLTITLQQRLPKDERSLAEKERIDDACSMLFDEGENVFLKVAS